MRRLRDLCRDAAPEPLRRRNLYAPPDYLAFAWKAVSATWRALSGLEAHAPAPLPPDFGGIALLLPELGGWGGTKRSFGTASASPPAPIWARTTCPGWWKWCAAWPADLLARVCACRPWPSPMTGGVLVGAHASGRRPHDLRSCRLVLVDSRNLTLSSPTCRAALGAQVGW